MAEQGRKKTRWKGRSTPASTWQISHMNRENEVLPPCTFVIHLARVDKDPTVVTGNVQTAVLGEIVMCCN